jgi:hypothetical protein
LKQFLAYTISPLFVLARLITQGFAMSPTKLPPGWPPRAMSIAEFCSAYGIGRTKAWQERKAGRLKVHYCGNRPLVGYDDAETWFHSLPADPDFDEDSA